MNDTQVTVVTVTYGQRWQFLSQVVKAVMGNDHVKTLIIVDNGSHNKDEIEAAAREHGNRIIVVRHEKNLGSAGGFASGLQHAQATQCDYVLALDDDNVPEAGFVEAFMEAKKLLPYEKVVLCGNRVDVPGSQRYFYQQSLRNPTPRGTFFEVFSMEKFANFLAMFFGFRVNKTADGPFIPITPNEGFIYGGAFMPIEAVRAAPLPDASLVLYGDDIEYSWGITDLGYRSYVCALPRIHDVDLSFGDSHIFGLFDEKTHPFKVYYRIRNMVRISIRNTYQLRTVLFLSVIIWTLGLCGLGLVKYGPTSTSWKRIRLIFQAVYAGYVDTAIVPQEAELP